mgnify:CR=1 FL=1
MLARGGDAVDVELRAADHEVDVDSARVEALPVGVVLDGQCVGGAECDVTRRVLVEQGVEEHRLERTDSPASVDERELTEARKQLALGGGGSGSAASEMVNGVAFTGRAVTGVQPKDLKPLADDAKQKLGSGVVVFIGVSEDGKASAVVGVTDDLTAKYSAVDLVRIASAALGGQGGGGRPDMAQAGGPDGSMAEAAIAAVKAVL